MIFCDSIFYDGEGTEGRAGHGGIPRNVGSKGKGVANKYIVKLRKQLRILGLIMMMTMMMMMRISAVTSAASKDTWWRLGVDGPWQAPHIYLSSSTALGGGDKGLMTPDDRDSPVRFCVQAQGPLSPGQLKLCYLYPDHMPAVSRGARLGLQECQWQFRQRRWNCSFVTSYPELDSHEAGARGQQMDEGLTGSSADSKGNVEEDQTDWKIVEDNKEYNNTSASKVRKMNNKNKNTMQRSAKISRSRRESGVEGEAVEEQGEEVKGPPELGEELNDMTDLAEHSPLFGQIMDIASPEAAFTHAILSAGVSHVISRACREGELSTCGCSPRSRPRSLPDDWLWGGCGDNTVYGYRFTQNFVDIKEREKNYPRHSKQLARMLMNLHNNEAGRRAVYSYSKVACKCHGVSGSCSLRTCWNQLSPFRQTGDRLKIRYDSATQVTFNQQGTYLMQRNRKFNKPTKEDLIYLDHSPDYCQADPSTGHSGTHGRRCDRHSMGIEGCGLLCCGRGYNSRDILLTERCQCKFEWCCRVKCKTCERTVNEDTCK